MLHFNAVWQLQTVVSCPSCGKEGKDAGFKDCCFRFALMRLGIQDRRKCPLCGENCNEEFCKGYEPYDRRFTNGCNSRCLHYGLDGRCTL